MEEEELLGLSKVVAMRGKTFKKAKHSKNPCRGSA